MVNNSQNLPPQVELSLPEPKRWYQHQGIIWIIALAIIACLSIWLYYAKQPAQNISPALNSTKNQQTANTNITAVANSGNSQPAIPVPDGWRDYHNDVFGLSFSYPPKWGDVTTYPYANITNLKTVRNNVDNSFNPSLNINFSANQEMNFPTSAPGITVWSPVYGGPQYNGAGMGHTDNLFSLSQSDNACSYKVNYQNGDSLQEIYNDCQNGVKVSVLEQTQHFNPTDFHNDPGMPASGILYTYSLNYYGYKHLQNGNFDYLLATYTATSTRQQALRLTSDEFLKQAGVSQGNYPNFKDFAIFVQSIKSYTPPVVTVPAFNIPNGEDPNITLIRKYYYDLISGQPGNAYQLLENPATSTEAFIAQSQNIYKAQPRDFKQLDTNKYEFWVDYQEQNNDPQQQRFIVEIINGQIKQDLFETLTSSIATSGNMMAYGASRGDKDIVVLRQGDTETIIDSAPNNFDQTLATLVFDYVNFSPQGSYLTYSAAGYEWASLLVYDIKNQKQALKTDGGTSGFNPTETLYFFCDKNDMGGDYEANVYQVPGFNVKLNLLKQFPELNNFDNVSCSQDQQNKVIKFKFTGQMDKNGNDNPNITKTYNVNLQTGELMN